jgi:hypothetical protein
VPRRYSARRFSLAGGLLLASLLGCTQLVVYDKYPGGVEAGASGNDGGGGGLGGSGGGGPFSCDGTLRTINFMLSTVDVIVALDRSTGMARSFDDGVQLAQGTADALDTVVANYQNSVRFALAMFPTPSPNCTGDPTCCVGPAGYPTSSGLAAFDANLAFCNMPGSCPTGSMRPIAAALDSCQRVYSSEFDQANSRYVLLVTSGDPGCGTDACGDARGKVSGLTAMFINTEVVVVGASDVSPCLSLLALTGSSIDAHRAATTSDLAGVLDDFAKKVAREACKVDLNGLVGPTDQLIVSQDHMMLPSGPNGSWDIDPGDRATIRLKGPACDRLLSEGPRNLSIKVCGH